ncbi:MAG: hypothetical protein HYS86_03905 [Candidatus Chisholmbacteria bacterium]|nr:hypothetical protein [Candidatus Chisholmbacteria bacterium]
MRQSIFLILLAFTLLLVVVRYGIPLLIRLAVFVSDVQGGRQSEDRNVAAILVPPVLDTLPEATFSGELDVTGFAQEGLLVALFVNGNPEEDVIVDDLGEFEVIEVTLRSGKNRLWATARDEEGNESEKSAEVVVIVDQSKPVITINSPEDGKTVTEKSIEVSGLVDEEATVTINGQFALQGTDNSFAKSMSLSEGENSLTIVAEDAAGNRTEKTLKVTYSPS